MKNVHFIPKGTGAFEGFQKGSVATGSESSFKKLVLAVATSVYSAGLKSPLASAGRTTRPGTVCV